MNLQEFTWIYMNFSESPRIYQNLPEFTWNYLNLPEFTIWVHLGSLGFTWVHLCSLWNMVILPIAYLTRKQIHFWYLKILSDLIKMTSFVSNPLLPTCKPRTVSFSSSKACYLPGGSVSCWWLDSHTCTHCSFLAGAGQEPAQTSPIARQR